MWTHNPLLSTLLNIATSKSLQQTQGTEPMLFLLLGQRRRRWPNNKTTLDQRLVAAVLDFLSGNRSWISF